MPIFGYYNHIVNKTKNPIRNHIFKVIVWTGEELCFLSYTSFPND